ncbi:hypothetical protein ABZY09_31180 [Streptomyces sp. NPDC002928]|uniref:hypothetical protein n=1 Tax=Streptomyces sp. NPDC002928 TaxID=3154440 RepID=UPI0033BF3517
MVPLLLSGVLLTACSGGGDSASASGASPTGAKDKQLAFAKCMRENGLPKFPDPNDDGGSVIGKDSGIEPNSPEFKKAQEACKDLDPQGESGPNGGKPIDAAKGRAWANCIRDNGVKDFPDPDADTGQVDMTGVGTGGEDPKLDKAFETCEDKRPAGITMRQNGGGQ